MMLFLWTCNTIGSQLGLIHTSDKFPHAATKNVSSMLSNVKSTQSNSNMVSVQKQSLNSSIATGMFGKIHSPKRKLNKHKYKSESYMKVTGLSGANKIS